MGKSLKKFGDRFSITMYRFIIKHIITVKNKIVTKPLHVLFGIFSLLFALQVVCFYFIDKNIKIIVLEITRF